MARPSLRFLRVLFLSTLVLTSLTASVLLSALPVQAALAKDQPVSGPLPAGVTVDTIISTNAVLGLNPNPIGIGQQLFVSMLVSPSPQPNRMFQGFTVTITKPDGSVTTLGPLYSNLSNGTAWFVYVPDQIGQWKLKFDFAGMYFPAGRYYNGQIITNSSGGTLYSESSYYNPVSTSQQIVIVQATPVQQEALQLSPTSGPGGATVWFSGSGYPANSSVTISYFDPSFSSWNSWSTVTTNSSGWFAFSSEMPDLRKAQGMGDQPETNTTLSFRAEYAGLVMGTVTYNEGQRGLKQVGNQLANGVYGNGTSLSYVVTVQAGEILNLTGKWFHPGVVYVRWDGVAVVGTVTGNEWRSAAIIGTSIANSQGYFEASATIPTASVGQHYVAIEDSQTIFITQVSLANPAALHISPSSGPGGITVQLTGSGYPASAPVVISYQDPSSGTWRFMTNVTANDSGAINFTVEMPDLQRSAGVGDWPSSSYNALSYMATCQGIVYSYAEYDEYMRGLTRIGSMIPTGLYGNGTNLATIYGNGTSAQVKPGDVIPITGKWFHPNDVIYIRWDGFAVVGTVSGNEWRNAVLLGSTIADASGSFATTVTIPDANPGEHYLEVEDSQGSVIVKVLLSPGTLQLSPSLGPGGANVDFTGTGYPAFSPVSVSYLDPYDGLWKFWTSTKADAKGNIRLAAEIPDSRKSVSSGDLFPSYQSYTYRTDVNSSTYSYASYTEYWRGLKAVGTQIASGLFGNGTNLASTVNVTAGDGLTLSGRWFHPGVIYVRWDGTAVVGTVTSDQWRNAVIIGTVIAGESGSFETAVSIPNATEGEHYIAIEDSQTTLIIKVYARPLYTPAPGPEPTPTPTPTPTPQPIPTLPTPKITILCASETTSFGFRVDIQGNLTLNGAVVRAQPVFIQYSVNSGTSWQDLTQTSTDSTGKYLAVWMPTASGSYLIRARCDANAQMNSVNATTNLALTSALGNNMFSVNSNSTISAFSFNSTSRELSFTVNGTSGTSGFVSITIPKTLMTDVSGMNVTLDGNQVAYSVDSTTDFWIISVSYTNSVHTVIIKMTAVPSIPEMPNEWTPSLVIDTAIVISIAVSAEAILKKNKRYRKDQSLNSALIGDDAFSRNTGLSVAWNCGISCFVHRLW